MLILVVIPEEIASDASLTFVWKYSNIIDLEIYKPCIEKCINNM